MFSYSYAVVQQQEEDSGKAEIVLRRDATRGYMLAGDTRGQQSEHGLLPGSEHRHDRPDRGAFETNCIRHSMRERAGMARPNQQVSQFFDRVLYIKGIPKLTQDLS